MGIRYGVKLLELKFSKDKRVIKGPGAPKLEDAQRAAALNKSTTSMLILLCIRECDVMVETAPPKQPLDNQYLQNLAGFLAS